jgi:hypothetical protein
MSAVRIKFVFYALFGKVRMILRTDGTSYERRKVFP